MQAHRARSACAHRRRTPPTSRGRPDAPWRRSRAPRTARRSTFASSSMSSGRSSAAEFTDTLSAPASRTACASADRAHAAADRERHEHLVGGAARQPRDRVALLVRRGDVEEDELVGALAVVVGGELDGIAGVADVDEFDTLHHAARVHVEAGYDALVVHRPTVACVIREPRAAPPGAFRVGRQARAAAPSCGGSRRAVRRYSPPARACCACAIVKRRSYSALPTITP